MLGLVVFIAFASASHFGSSTPFAQSFFVETDAVVDAAAVHEIKLVFKPSRPQELESRFRSNSDPENVGFAQHLSQEEVCHLVGPSLQARKTVVSFLRLHQLTSVGESACGDVWTVTGTTRAMEKAFKMHLKGYRSNIVETEVIVAAETISLPKHIAKCVALVHGLHFPTVLARKRDRVAVPMSSEYATATPENLKTLYGIGNIIGKASNNSQGVAGWEHQSYSVGDLKKFQEHYNISLNPIRKVYGHNTGFPHTESNLDTQTISSVGGENIKTDFYLNSGLSFDVLDWAYAISNETFPALVWSLSYGEDLTSKTIAYSRATNSVFEQLALRGITICVASGDSGSMSRQSPDSFAAEFPASLPSVTAVGATVLNTNLSETQTVSCSEFEWCSGGGFTLPSYFELNSSAPWQQAYVAKYLTQPSLPALDKYSKFIGGVGFPDVAAVGSNHEIYYFRLPEGVAGTSASCPTFAGIVALLNDARLLAGKKSLGFINQIVYSQPQLWKDIQLGNTGWPATPSWDATTGMGSIADFQALSSYVLSLP